MLAIAASSATSIALAAPSMAASFGTDDEEVITGIYAAQLEATRSCSIEARGTVNDDLFGGNYTSRGTTVRLSRKSGSKNATGSARISFDAQGANAVYFENFGIGTFEGEAISDIQEDGKLDGNISVVLDGEQPYNAADLSLQQRRDFLGQIDQNADINAINSGRELAFISSQDRSKAGLIVGGQDDKGISNIEADIEKVDVEKISSFFSRPTSRDATVKLTIKDVDKTLKGSNAVIQARLVCAPLIVTESGVGTIRPRE